MFVRDVKDCREFLAGDATRLREILHPDKEALAIRYSLAHAALPPGAASRPHRLRTAEVYYILHGRGRMHIGADAREVGAGQTVYIPPGALQHIVNTGMTQLSFLCIVDPAWHAEDEEVL